MVYILKCTNCGTLFKCLKKQNENFITDFGDVLNNTCMHCHHKLSSRIIKTEDWIADLIFRVKGN